MAWEPRFRAASAASRRADTGRAGRRGTTWRKIDASAQMRVVDAASAVDAMLAHPSAIKRPVVEAHAEVIVGFVPADWERRFAPRRPGADTGSRLR